MTTQPLTDIDKIRAFAKGIAKDADDEIVRCGVTGAHVEAAKAAVARDLLALLDSLPAPPACPECDAPADHCVECGTPYPQWLVRAAVSEPRS